MTRYLILALLVFSGTASFAQSAPDRRAGELLIQLEGDAVIEGVLADLEQQMPNAAFSRLVSRTDDWRIFRIGFNEQAVQAEVALQLARRTAGIRVAQFNHRAIERNTEPNDPDWWRQGDMTLIGMPEAWDISTGGLTPAGDTIVVAVLEKGLLLSHPDLINNRWYNWKEVPDNQIDDDNNGYVDDFVTWDARNGGDGPGNSGNHGTSVNGIIGAQGNNLTGVSGVNWNVRLMNITNVEYEDEIIEAYRYVANMRKRYNQSNGADGAFVVVTNASFGIDREPASNHPVWCAVYDSLGKQGILSIGATSNSNNNNVDLVGDMPTSCPSEYLITVTNVDKLDNLVAGAGFGTVSIDLGAPGQDTYTTSNSGPSTPTYGTLGGTSAAAPHVSGAIALLYSLDCSSFTEDALSNPSACARRVRDIILDNTEPNNTLEGKTRSGGRLAVGSAVQAVQELCGGTRGALDIVSLNPNPVAERLEITFQTPTYDLYPIRIFNALGQLMYETNAQPEPFASSRIFVETASWPAGMYFATINRGQFVKSKKFLKI